MYLRRLWMKAYWANLYSEWLTHQHRDTLSSIVGHPTLLSYLSIADGEATGRTKFEMTEVCGFNFDRFDLYSSCHPQAHVAALWTTPSQG